MLGFPDLLWQRLLLFRIVVDQHRLRNAINDVL
ncbi:MAG: hypothetical protein ACI90G_002217, partial [Urechidicola sp.]